MRVRWQACFLTVILLTGCVASTRAVQETGACEYQSKTLVLDVQPLPMPYGCHGHQAVCAAYLIGAGAVGVATTIVSGSIVLVGNTVYWLERQAGCLLGPAAQ